MRRKRLQIRKTEDTILRSHPKNVRLYAICFCFLFERGRIKEIEESLVVVALPYRSRLLSLIRNYGTAETASYERVYPGSKATLLGVSELSRIYDPLKPGCEILFRQRRVRSLKGVLKTIISNDEIAKYVKETR